MEEFAYLIAEEIYNSDYILKVEQGPLSVYIEKFAQNIISRDQLQEILYEEFALENSEIGVIINLIVTRLKNPQYYEQQESTREQTTQFRAPVANNATPNAAQNSTQTNSQTTFADRIYQSNITTTRTTSSSFNTTPQQSPISSPTQPTPQQNTPPKLDPYREAI